MKSSILIAATGAVLAMAGPLQKRKYVTTVETYMETVTVTGGAESTPLPTPAAGQKQRPETTEQAPAAQSVVVVTETYVPQPAPEPTTTTPTVVYVTQSPEPEPTTQEPTTTQEAAVSPSSIAAPQPSAPSDDDFQGSALYHHNLHRANHSSPEVSWDSKIAGYAGITARKCVFAHDMYVNMSIYFGHQLTII